MLRLSERFTFGHHQVAWGKVGAGPPLVLIHGTPFSSQVWRRIAPLLGQRWTVYYYDMLGYGLSDKPDTDVSLGVQNRLLVDLLRHWKLERPDVLCHDFGGATALRAYFLDGARFRSMTMFDVVALSPWGSPFVSHVRRHEEAFAGLPSFAHEALLKVYLQGSAFGRLTDYALGIYMAPWTGSTGQQAFYRQIAQMDQKYTEILQPLLSAPDCPVRILWGEQDQWIPIEQGEALARTLKAERLNRIPQAGHLVQEDAPEAIVASMLEHREYR